jgi:two-component system, NarL family, sensor histidine kinase UhpB
MANANNRSGLSAMWKSLSLPTRLNVLFCTLLAGALAVLLVSLLAFSAGHLEHGREPVERVAAQIASAINTELRADPAEREVVTRLLRQLNTQATGSLRYRDATTTLAAPPSSAFQVPAWFARMLGADAQPRALPIAALSGDLVLYPGDSSDVYEKWIAFLFIVAAPIAIGLLAFAVAQLTVRATLRPLRELSAAISRLKDGNYNNLVACQGPPEIQRACEQINALANVLTTLQASNQEFMKRIVGVQDDERAEIGRDLHDEFAPLLFAARANARALQTQGGSPALAAQASEISRIVEAIQKTNSRLLARLRPLDLENLGLARNIAALTDSPAARAGNLATDIRLDPAIDRLDELAARTVYRFVQEAITNILRHAKASQAGIRATHQGSLVTAEVSDNGIGMPEGTPLGRGLEGMKERIGALGGTFWVASSSSGTVVRCTFPVG